MHNRWVIAFACAWINFFIFCVFRSAGVVYLRLIDEFHCTYQQAAWSVSLAGSVASTTGIVSGFLTHYFSSQTLILIGIVIQSFSIGINYFVDSIFLVIILVGVVQGIGIGFIVTLLPAVLNVYFAEKKVIALGISYAGATLGAFIFPILIQWLFDRYHYHGTMFIMGGLIMNAALGALLFYSPFDKRQTLPNQLDIFKNEQTQMISIQDQASNRNRNQEAEELQEVKESKNKTFWKRFKNHFSTDAKLLSNIYFALCAFTYLNFIFDFIAFIIIVPDVAKDRNINDENSRWLLSIFSITDFLGRLAPGCLVYSKLVTNKTLYVVSITIMGLCMLLLTIIESWPCFIVVALFQGFAVGCQMVLSPAVLADYLGNRNTAVAFGMSNFICGLLTLFFRPLIIGLKDISGNYNMTGYILSSLTMCCVACWLFEMFHQKFPFISLFS